MLTFKERRTLLNPAVIPRKVTVYSSYRNRPLEIVLPFRVLMVVVVLLLAKVRAVG